MVSLLHRATIKKCPAMRASYWPHVHVQSPRNIIYSNGKESRLNAAWFRQ